MKTTKRKAIPKATREQVYKKYNGHCAYCGCELEYKDMQVDHFIPFRNIKHGKNTTDEIECLENYMPTCRLCNWAKRSKNIETFRKYIRHVVAIINKSAAYRIAIKYRLIQETPHKIIFYFENFKQ